MGGAYLREALNQDGGCLLNIFQIVVRYAGFFCNTYLLVPQKSQRNPVSLEELCNINPCCIRLVGL